MRKSPFWLAVAWGLGGIENVISAFTILSYGRPVPLFFDYMGKNRAYAVAAMIIGLGCCWMCYVKMRQAWPREQ